MTDSVKHIVIIGGGLVGSLCACFLAKRGFHVEVYEARQDLRKSIHGGGRSINLALSHRGRNALRIIGLEDAVLQQTVPLKGRLLHNLPNEKKSVLYDEHTHQCIYSVRRSMLNGLLLTAAEKHPNVKLYFSCKLVDVSLLEGSCTILNTNTNETFDRKADLIVGSDGAFSKVRRSMQQLPLFQYNQTYIEHGYIELSIPADRGHLMTPNHLHIWPRGEFMMIALPNDDNSWTVTLFMSLMKFKSIRDKSTLLKFFETTFPDAIDLIGDKELGEQFFSSPPSHLVSIKCSPYHFQNKILIIGDAAHAMVPFYGQGMNCGFEDCTFLDQLLTEFNDDFDKVLDKFTQFRKDDAFAICDLAMYNFVEMRDLVTKPTFYLRKLLDNFLFKLFPEVWIPLYNSVSFSNIRYTDCMKNRKWQNTMITGIASATLVFFLLLFYILIF